VVSRENVPIFEQVRWDIHGFLQRKTPALLKAAEVTMMQEYSNNFRDAGFYLADGSPTAHRVLNSSTVRGVRVASRPFFPESKGAEGVRWRNYTLALEWEEPLMDDGTLLTGEESVRIIGTGGPDWDIVPGVVGVPVVMPKTAGSKIVVVQAGRFTARGRYMPARVPMWTEEPPLHGPSSVVETYNVPGPMEERVTSWQYTFFFPTRPELGPSYFIPKYWL